MKGNFRQLAGFIAAALAVALLAGPSAQAQNPMGANKTAAIGNTVDEIELANTDIVLREQLRVSSPADFIINLSAECAIITQLITGATNGNGDTTSSATVEGTVELWVEIDGKPVPVAGDPNGNGDDGDVVFCNESRGRKVTDDEDAMDGQDEIADYNSARQANAFQWLATNVGFAYDDVALNGQNIIDVTVHARFTDTDGTDCDALAIGEASTFTQTCSNAFVGKRTLIVEHTKATVIEQTASSNGGS